jgi:hypothetical protein
MIESRWHKTTRSNIAIINKDNINQIPVVIYETLEKTSHFLFKIVLVSNTKDTKIINTKPDKIAL